MRSSKKASIGSSSLANTLFYLVTSSPSSSLGFAATSCNNAFNSAGCFLPSSMELKNTGRGNLYLIRASLTKYRTFHCVEGSRKLPRCLLSSKVCAQCVEGIILNIFRIDVLSNHGGRRLEFARLSGDFFFEKVIPVFSCPGVKELHRDILWTVECVMCSRFCASGLRMLDWSSISIRYGQYGSSSDDEVMKIPNDEMDAYL